MRKVHNEELSDLYSPIIAGVINSRRMKLAGHVAILGESGGVRVYGALVWKPEGKRQLGRPRCRWEDNIKMDLQEVVHGRLDRCGSG